MTRGGNANLTQSEIVATLWRLLLSSSTRAPTHCRWSFQFFSITPEQINEYYEHHQRGHCASYQCDRQPFVRCIRQIP
ncbi:hypothetical protein D9M73_104460 [compost metagenome]